MRIPDPFAERYTKLQFIGRGGFGVVYKAWDLEMEREIALKLLNPELAVDTDWRKRFRQEATAASKFNHPNIVFILDRGEFENQPFIVMELVDGEPLSALIERRAPLTIPERLFLLQQLCDGLHYAHLRQIVHRDIKPVNLIVKEEHDGTQLMRTLKILDFGIAKSVSSGQTSTGQMMFTPNYVSPEQIRGEEVDGRSDMFAVGAVAYELIAWEKAFTITSTNPFSILDEVRRKIVDEPHRPLTAVRPDIDRELSDLIDRALAKHPEERFQDLAEMRRHLHRITERLKADESGDTTVILSPKQQAAIKRGREALEADDPTAAVESFQKALAAGTNPVVRRFIEQEIEEAQERQAVRRAEQRKQQEEAARAAIEKASAAFQRGDMTVAISGLEQFKPAELVARIRDDMTLAAALLRRAERIVREGDGEERAAILREIERFSPQELVTPHAGRLQAHAAERAAAERAQQSVAAATQAFSEGRYAEALESLEAFDERPLVLSAIETLREALSAIQAASSVAESGDRRTRAEAIENLATRYDARLVGAAVEALRAKDARVRAEEDHRDAAAAAIAAAEQQFASGDRSGALSRLEGFSPPHPTVDAALDELRARARRIEEEVLAREKAARAVVEEARRQFAGGRRKAAIESLQRFGHPELVADAVLTLRRLEDAIARAEQRVRTGSADERRAAIVGLSRADPDVVGGAVEALREIDARRTADEQRHAEEEAALGAIERADEVFAAGRHEEAIALLEGWPGKSSAVAAAIGDLRGKLRAIEEERARAVLEQQARDVQQQARALFAEGQIDEALTVLRRFKSRELVAPALREFQQAADDIEAARTEVATKPAAVRRTAIERIEGRKPRELFIRAVAELRQLDAERTADEERAEAARVAAAAERAALRARQQFARGEYEASLRALETYTPQHPAIGRALEELRGEFAIILEARREKAQQEQERLEAERRAREEEEQKERAAAEAARRAREEEERQRLETERAARAAQEAEERRQREAEEAARLAREEEERRQREAEEAARLAQEEEERRRVEAEHAAKVREVAALVAEVSSAIVALRFQDARAILERAAALLPDAPDILQAREHLARAVETEEHRETLAQVQHLLGEASSAVAGGRLQEAEERLNAAERLCGTVPVDESRASVGAIAGLRRRIAAASAERARMSGALRDLRNAIEQAGTESIAVETRLGTLDRLLAAPAIDKPGDPEAAAHWSEYDDARRQLRQLSADLGVRAAADRIERAFAARSLRKIERELKAAESAFPDAPVWAPLRSRFDELRKARAAEPSLAQTAIRRIRQVPRPLVAGIAATLVVTAALAIWRPWAVADGPAPPINTGGESAPTVAREETLFKDASARLATGQRDEAIRLAVDSLRANASYAPARQFLERLRSEAASAAAAARDKAMSANAGSRASFKTGEQKNSDARAITDPLQSDVAIRTFNEAADLYRRSETEAFSADEFLDAARQEQTAGRVDTAVKYALDGLSQYPGNDALGRFLTSLRNEALKKTTAAQQAARRAGATVDNSRAMVAAEERRRLAVARNSPEQTADALVAFRDAERLYGEAEKEAKDFAASISSFVNTAKAQAGRGDLVGAAGTVIKGLGAAPGNPDLLAILESAVKTAETDANAAKRAAETANAAGRPQFASAESRLQTAGSKRQSAQPDAVAGAVADFAEAGRLYREAARLGPVAPPPPPPLPIAETVSAARDLIRQRDYPGAASRVVDVLGKAPKNTELLGALGEVLQAAESDANAAKRDADLANATNLAAYADASSRLLSAGKAKDSGRPVDAQSAVRDYVSAARLFREAATKAVPAPPPPPPSNADAAIRQLLVEYEAAYESLDIQRVRRLRPKSGGYPADLQSTDLRISNVRLTIAPDGQSAVVNLTIQPQHKFNRALPSRVEREMARPSDVVLQVRLTPAGWIITN